MSGRHRAVARDRVARLLRKHGATIPSTRPIVQWRAADRCRDKGGRCWLLDVYLTPDGWALAGRDFRAPVPEWLDRTGYSLDEYRPGLLATFSPRIVTGAARVLPLNPRAWPPARFEVGCTHRSAWVDLAMVADDCATARASRSPVTRDLLL